MAQLIFDKDTENERVFECDSVFEHPMQYRLNAVKNVSCGNVNFPNIDYFKSNPDFENLHLRDDDIVIPIVCDYNHIDDVSVSYYTKEKQYTVGIVVGRTEKE